MLLKQATEDRREFAATDLQAVFGENLKAARLKAGLKQSELAEKTGLTQQYLSLIETGRKNVTLRTMMELAKIVGQEVSVMLRRTRSRP
jgi:HTH-type transcriptional regulator/antitoxin HipB